MCAPRFLALATCLLLLALATPARAENNNDKLVSKRLEAALMSLVTSITEQAGEDFKTHVVVRLVGDVCNGTPDFSTNHNSAGDNSGFFVRTCRVLTLSGRALFPINNLLARSVREDLLELPHKLTLKLSAETATVALIDRRLTELANRLPEAQGRALTQLRLTSEFLTNRLEDLRQHMAIEATKTRSSTLLAMAAATSGRTVDELLVDANVKRADFSLTAITAGEEEALAIGLLDRLKVDYAVLVGELVTFYLVDLQEELDKVESALPFGFWDGGDSEIEQLKVQFGNALAPLEPLRPLSRNLTALMELSRVETDGNLPSTFSVANSTYGGYRLKLQDSLVSIGAMAGFAGGLEDASAQDRSLYNRALYYGSFFPIGIDFSRAIGQTSYGLFISTFNLGNLATASNHERTDDNNYVDNDPHPRLQSILEMGLYVYLRMGANPFIVGYGAAQVSRARGGKLDGADAEFSVIRRNIVFIGIDLTFLPIH